MEIGTVFWLFLCIPSVFSTGEVKEAMPDDPEIKKALNFAMDQLNKMSNNMYRYMAFETLDATKQVIVRLKHII